MRKILDWLDKKLDKLIRLQLPPMWEEPVQFCEECEGEIEPGQGCPECKARVINMKFAGFAGTWFDQPEPAEGLIWCPICQADTDASWEWTWAYCQTGEHEVELWIDDGIDPDLAYDEWREREYEQKHGH